MDALTKQEQLQAAKERASKRAAEKAEMEKDPCFFPPRIVSEIEGTSGLKLREGQREDLQYYCVGWYRQWESWKAEPSYQDIKTELQSLQSKIDKAVELVSNLHNRKGNQNKAANRAAEAVTAYYQMQSAVSLETLLGHLIVLQNAAHDARKGLRGPAGAGLQPSLLHPFIGKLAAFYERVKRENESPGGQIKLTAHYHKKTGKPGGEFVDFVCAVFDRLPGDMLKTPSKKRGIGEDGKYSVPDLVKTWIDGQARA